MNKIFKRITASVMAVTTLAVGMGGMSSNAAVTNYDWATRYVAGAPGSASTSDTCNLVYSTYGAKVKCISSSHSNVNASGWTWVECPNTNAYMASDKLYYDSPKIYRPRVSGIVTYVKYNFNAYSTASSGDTFNTSGKIAARASVSDCYQ